MLTLKSKTKLGEVIPFLPNGLIDKRETGIGATTLEATCNRNSIIVEPTRAIVADKSKIHHCLGVMGGIKEPEILTYLSIRKHQNRKVFVVSDSVGRLLHILKKAGEDVFKDYFYLIDECEQYITESGYRENMGIALDYYWDFPEDKRALISAFIYDFSNQIGRASCRERV